MARRVRGGGEVLVLPERLRRFVAEEWADPADESSSLAAEWGVALARQVLPASRWTEARRRWAREHGMQRFPRDRGRA